MSAKDIPRLVRGDRGFIGYGEPFTCTYGTKIEVYESSVAEAPHVWLNATEDPRVLQKQKPGNAAAHLNVEQAKALIDRLQAWIDDIPERWGT